MNIPLVDLKAQYIKIEHEIKEAVEKVIRETAFINGPYAKRLEQEFAAYTGAEFAVGVNSGTDALMLSLKALELQSGDEVIVPAMTFIATGEAVTLAGGKVVFSDVDPVTRCIDPRAAAAAVTPRTKGIIAVHLYGHPADMAALQAIAKEHGLWIIEDAAQAHGAICGDRRVGSIGVTGCFSFYPGKNLGAYGDAGMIVTSEPVLEQKMRMMANHGRLKKYGHVFEGMNSRMDGIQAAILLAKLKYLGDWTKARRDIADGYRQSLDGLDLCLPKDNPGHVYHLFVIETPRRDELRKNLNEAGISASIHYPQALHLLEAYRHLGYREGQFPVSEHLAKTVLSLPIYPEIKASQREFVASQVRSFFEGV